MSLDVLFQIGHAAVADLNTFIGEFVVKDLAKGSSDADEVGGYIFAVWGVVPNQYFPLSIPSSRACSLGCSLVQKR